MSLLANLSVDSEAEGERDSLGGGFILDTDVYEMEITMAYIVQAESEALGLALHMKTEDGTEYRETPYFQSGKKKGKKTYYVTQKGEKRNLPGFNTVDTLCLLTVGYGLLDMQQHTEKKVVNIYNHDLKKEVPTEVEALTPLIGQKILAGIQKQLVDVTKRDEGGDYHPTGETKEENEIDKLFCAHEAHYGKTVIEIQAKAEEAVFINSWKEKFRGTVRDRTTKDVARGAAGAPKAAGAAAGGSSKPTKSLFG